MTRTARPAPPASPSPSIRPEAAGPLVPAEGAKPAGPLETLIRGYAPDLLGLLGDAGASLLAVESVFAVESDRRVEGLLRLERQGEVYCRHVELRVEDAPDVAVRCFEHDTALLLRRGLPVLTTVVYLVPPGPRVDPVFRVAVRGREVNRWRFETVRLWEMDAGGALHHGTPGSLALLPLMRGGWEWGRLERAARRIEAAFPGEALPDAEAVLLHLAGHHYTLDELVSLVGRERMIESSWSEHFRREGREEGHRDGRLEAHRELCLQMVREFHPGLAESAAPLVAACADPERLARGIASAPRLTGEELERLLRG